MIDDLSRELNYKEYVMREDYLFHAPYNPEMEFYKSVMAGDKKKVEESLKEDFCDKKGLGVLSDNNIRNFRYHFVITAALLSRYCIRGGMEHEKAYNISDLYINKVDKCKDLKEISELHKKMVREYTKRMSEIRNKKVYSKHIVMSLNYIYDHLHERITLESIAEEIGISEAYLSRLFKKMVSILLSHNSMKLLPILRKIRIESVLNGTWLSTRRWSRTLNQSVPLVAGSMTVRTLNASISKR